MRLLTFCLQPGHARWPNYLSDCAFLDRQVYHCMKKHDNEVRIRELFNELHTVEVVLGLYPGVTPAPGGRREKR